MHDEYGGFIAINSDFTATKLQLVTRIYSDKVAAECRAGYAM